MLTDAVDRLDEVGELDFHEVRELMNLIKSNLSDWKDFVSQRNVQDKFGLDSDSKEHASVDKDHKEKTANEEGKTALTHM